MPKTLTATEVARGFADVLNRVAYRRESLVVVRGQRSVAGLRPLPMATRLADLPALLATLPRLDHADALKTDLDAARRPPTSAPAAPRSSRPCLRASRLSTSTSRPPAPTPASGPTSRPPARGSGRTTSGSRRQRSRTA